MIKRIQIRKSISSLVAVVAMVGCVSIMGACNKQSAGDAPSSTAKSESTDELAVRLIGEGALLVDVRTPSEFAQGFIEGAINISHDQIAARVAELGADKNRAIVLYCRSGRRSGIATKTLKGLGFTEVMNAGGYKHLKSLLSK